MKLARIIPLSAAGLAGLAAAVALTFPAIANAWDWTHLPAGYTVHDSIYHPSGGGSCDRITVNGTYIGDACDTANFQTALDAYINSTICTVNPAAGGSACVTTTATAAATTTTTVATTDPGTTSATTTAAAAPVGTAPSATASTQTVTTTETVTVSDPALTARVTTLEAEYAALAARVGAIEQANAAAEAAYNQAITAGDSPELAASIAISTALNTLYGLG